MGTTDTCRRILDTAEGLFARDGYGATSLRRIIAAANVNLAAIHYHFGSKEALFTKVMERRLQPLNAERLRRLDALEEKAGDRPVRLELIIEAYLAPLIGLARDEEHGADWCRLVGRLRAEPGPHWTKALAIHRDVLQRFLVAFRRALPKLPGKEVGYRVYFLGGAAANSITETQSLHVYGEGLKGVDEDPEGVLARLIRFLAAGMRAPATHAGTAGRQSRGAKVPRRGRTQRAAQR